MTATTEQPAQVPTLSFAERDRRWALARAFMQRTGLEAMLIFGEHEDGGPGPFCFDTWFTNDRPGSTVLLPKTGEPIVFARLSIFFFDHIEATRRGDGSWVTAQHFRAGDNSSMIVNALNETGLAKAVIGVIGLDPYIPVYFEGFVHYGLWKNIKEQCPAADFRSVGMEFSRLMMPLSEEEVTVVQHSAHIGDAMVRAMVESAKPGISEAEVYAAAMAAAHKRGTVTPAMHFWSGEAPASAGPPQWAYRPQPARVLQRGDLISSEIFCSFGMLQTQHQAAIAIGKVHKNIERAAEIARVCYDAGIERLSAGARFGDVAEAMLKPVEDAGGWVRGPQIHGLNPFGSLCRIPAGRSQIPGAERYPDSPEIPTLLADMKLERGMTFAVEPSCGFGNHLVTIGGTVIVDADKPIEPNKYSARLLRAAI